LIVVGIIEFGTVIQSKKIFFLFGLLLPSIGNGQTKVNAQDSVEIKKQIEGFYTWYIDVAKDRQPMDGFSPVFARKENGMTTLDFGRYKETLLKYQFTGGFIQRKVNEYAQCVDSLAKIPFDKFSLFTDLDDFERIGCDFGNRYEWTGGQEARDKAELISLKLMDQKTIIGNVGFKPDGNAVVTFRKIGKRWRVDDIKI
jgi:hypothetical protein